MKKEPIILIGGGGHCISCIDVIEQSNRFDIIGILDLPEKVGSSIQNYPIIGTDENIGLFAKKCSNFHITIGQIKSSLKREIIYREIKKNNGILPIIISPFSYVSKNAIISEGSIVMHNAIVNASAKIGCCCIINSKALIEHDAVIGDFCHISTASIVNGKSNIGSKSFIGSNSVIGNNIFIKDETIISAGSIVLKDIAVSGIYFGNNKKKSH